MGATLHSTIRQVTCTPPQCGPRPATMNTALLAGFGVAIVLLLIGSILISAVHRSRAAAARRRRAAAIASTHDNSAPARTDVAVPPPPPAAPPPPFSHHAVPFPAHAAWPRAFHAAHGPGARAAYPVLAVYRAQPGAHGQGVAVQAAIIAPWVTHRSDPDAPPPFDPDELAVFKVAPEHRQTQCGICLDPFETDDVSAGQCFHKFHSTCIKSWLAKDAARSCPVCRNSFLGTPGLDGIVDVSALSDDQQVPPAAPPPPNEGPYSDSITPATAPT